MIPPLVYALWNSLRDPRRKGASLLSLTATTTYSGRCGEIVPGQIVLYSAVKPGTYQQIEGRVIAVSDGQQVVFGEATLEGQTVVVNGKPYPPHLVRGVVWAVMRPLPTPGAPDTVSVSNQSDS